MAAGTRNRAIRFAEDELGVHSVFTETVQLEESIRKLSDEHAQLEFEIHGRELSLEDALFDMREKVRSAPGNESLSATAFEGKVKDAVGNDSDIRDLKGKIVGDKGMLATLASELREAELKHRSRVARMNLLGGYMQYLASAKNANTTARATVNDWPY